MSDKPYHHLPALLKEAIDFLNIKKGGTYVDCTLGGGGHSEAILEQGGKVIGIDADKEAIAAAKERLAKFNSIEFINDNFRNLRKHTKTQVNGILFDLGVSSYQINEASRGFSLQHDGPLDMRMDQGQKITAEELINRLSRDELQRIFKVYGEERFSGRIASAIVHKREKEEIKTTFQLKEIIEKAIPTWKKRESVTRIFQALRIAVNHELEALEGSLRDAVSMLKPGGRLVVISYHSLEDRLAKQHFRAAKQEGKARLLTKKPVRAQDPELSSNPRARSAKLRALEKA
ncbi:16S rRNA (cytosine(1402)-N(4))-methyltransferase RsmH [Candidatus Margulisiibacteriota bacterium]